ncbi:MAG TPA: ATP-binding protein [Blastocatellia bacterium]|nr:ATP-binding protein [Blastocatellia bacterium]
MKFGRVENKARLAIFTFVLILLLLIGLSLGLYLRARGQAANSPLVVYLFSYQLIALVFGLCMIFLLVRWLLRPYRRMVEAARDSPVHATTAISESEFVVETFQALVEQLRAKERELAQLHALERRRAERSERLSERLIANIPSGLVTVDRSGAVTAANAHALKILGARINTSQLYEPGTAMFAPGEDYRTFLQLSPRLVEMIGECLDSGRAFRREEVMLVLPDGRARHLGLSISPIAEAAQSVEGALCLLTDITEVLELRERIRLQENLANLGEMAAGLAHEFKNSLATIHGYVQLLESQMQRPQAGEQRVTLDAMLKEVRVLTQLVTDFLNFARPQQLNVTPVALDELIAQCVAETRMQLADGGIKLNTDGEFAEVAADESLLRRVFLNLIRNAIEAIDPNAPEKLIRISGAVDADPHRRFAHVRVADTGGGIASADLHRIFIPFFTTKSRGYGIGLALVQKILMAHGGDVLVESSSSAGTVFHCRIPLSPPATDMEKAS